MLYKKFTTREAAHFEAQKIHNQFGEPILVLEDIKSDDFLIADPVAYRLWREDLQERYKVIEEFQAGLEEGS
jgi:hypothetical protein